MDEVFKEIQVKENIYKDHAYVEHTVNKTVAMLEKGKYNQAICLLKEVIKNKEYINEKAIVHLINSFNILGLCYSSLGNYDKAIETYDNGLIYEKSKTLLNNKALAYKQKGDYTKALEVFSSIEPSNNDTYFYDNIEKQKKLIVELIKKTDNLCK